MSEVDLAAAEHFLTLLDEESDRWHFRTFHDRDEGHGRNYPAGGQAGDMQSVAESLGRENAGGRGVYVVVNEGGHDDDSITRVRAVFADFDPPKTAALPAEMPLEPHFIVESSPGKHHAYWLVDGLAVGEFKATQQAIAGMLGSDASVCNPSRVMRLPGFLHRKGEPFQSRIIHESGALPYSADAIRTAFPAATQPATARPAAPVDGNILEGGRDVALTSLAGTMRRRGFSEAAILAALQVENVGRCQPPLSDDQVAKIARSVGRYEPADAIESSPAAKASSFTWGDQMTAPGTLRPSEWTVRKLLPTECTGLLYGGWGTCKTFMAIDLAGCIANGVHWHGKPTLAGTVFYLAGEGEGGFARRLAAWEAGNNGSTANIAFREMPEVRNPRELQAVAEQIEALAAERGTPRLIVLDTLFTALNGGDENSGRDMGEVFAAMKVLRQRFRCAVLAVHHTGKSGEDARGHSSMPAGVDVQFYLKAKDAGGSTLLELSNPKQKDGKKHPPIFLTTESVAIPGLLDDDGEQESSLVIRAPAEDMVAAMQAEKDKAGDVEALKAEAQKLKAKGMTLAQIGEVVGRDKGTVSRWLRD